MPESHIPKAFEKFEIQAYRRKPKDLKLLKRTHVAFTGFPLKPPKDSQKMVLVADPHSGNSVYYEFRLEDIGYAEELTNITLPSGETIPIARIWVKKQAVGVRLTPFRVDDLAAFSPAP